MAQPTKQAKQNEIAGLDTFRNGGKGSGNFGHRGRPGEVGGSGDGMGLSQESQMSKARKGASALEKTSFGLFWGLEMAKMSAQVEMAEVNKRRAKKIASGEGNILDAMEVQLTMAHIKDSIADIDKMMSEKYRIESYGDGAKRALTDIKKALKGLHKEMQSYYDEWERKYDLTSKKYKGEK